MSSPYTALENNPHLLQLEKASTLNSEDIAQQKK